MKIVRRFPEGEVHNREEGEMAPKLGRREIYPPVPPPFSSTCILTTN